MTSFVLATPGWYQHRNHLGNRCLTERQALGLDAALGSPRIASRICDAVVAMCHAAAMPVEFPSMPAHSLVGGPDGVHRNSAHLVVCLVAPNTYPSRCFARAVLRQASIGSLSCPLSWSRLHRLLWSPVRLVSSIPKPT